MWAGTNRVKFAPRGKIDKSGLLKDNFSVYGIWVVLVVKNDLLRERPNFVEFVPFGFSSGLFSVTTAEQQTMDDEWAESSLCGNN